MSLDREAKIRSSVRQIVAAEATTAHHLADAQSFFGDAAIDSLVFLRILLAIEQRYGVILMSGEILLAELDSIDSLVAHVLHATSQLPLSAQKSSAERR